MSLLRACSPALAAAEGVTPRCIEDIGHALALEVLDQTGGLQHVLLCLGLLLKAIIQIKDTVIQEQLLCLFSSTLEFNSCKNIGANITASNYLGLGQNH